MKSRRVFLGIETSCDECSASVLESHDENGTLLLKVLSVCTVSQDALHAPFGGVVPEIASRNHLEVLIPTIDTALKKADVTSETLTAVAVTQRPGLVGALHVGVSGAKALAYAWNLPLLPVHHLEGHAVSLFLDHEKGSRAFEWPALIAIVSGGHTNFHEMRKPPETWEEDVLNSSCLGRSRDDAAGEAFDKCAKLLGFPYPGGKWIDEESKKGNPSQTKFPRALLKEAGFDVSFSGLKTAVSQEIQKRKQKGTFDQDQADLAASVQEAIVDPLIERILRAVREKKLKSIGVVGGVAANSLFRSRLLTEANVPVLFPSLKYCTDNAAMIAGAGAYRFHQGKTLSKENFLKLSAQSSA